VQHCNIAGQIEWQRCGFTLSCKGRDVNAPSEWQFLVVDHGTEVAVIGGGLGAAVCLAIRRGVFVDFCRDQADDGVQIGRQFRILAVRLFFLRPGKYLLAISLFAFVAHSFVKATDNERAGPSIKRFSKLFVQCLDAFIERRHFSVGEFRHAVEASLDRAVPHMRNDVPGLDLLLLIIVNDVREKHVDRPIERRNGVTGLIEQITFQRFAAAEVHVPLAASLSLARKFAKAHERLHGGGRIAPNHFRHILAEKLVDLSVLDAQFFQPLRFLQPGQHGARFAGATAGEPLLGCLGRLAQVPLRFCDRD